jgi:uncharacterized protein (DUF58 family)
MAAGVILCATGLHLGWPPVAQLGIFLLLLPAATLAAVSLRRDRVSAVRIVACATPQLGDPIPVALAVTPLGGGLGPIMVADTAPAVLGGTHVAAISGVPRQYTTRHRYQLLAARRGAHVLGPAQMILTDRFGLVARGREVGGTTEVVVVPRIHQLSAGIPAGATSGPGWGSAGAPGGTHDDVIPRDYRPGDELRRMDWRATARTGSLMVRGEEQPWRACLLVVLDRRARSHRGPAGADSLEAALSVVASVGAMALASAWDLRVVDLGATTIFEAHPGLPCQWNVEALSRALALLRASHDDHPDARLAAQVADGAPVLAVLGENDPGTVTRVADLLAGAHPAMAVVVAADTWAPTESPDPGPAAADAVRILGGAGWSVGVLTAVTDIPALWTRIRGSLGVRGGQDRDGGRQA